MGKAFWPKPKLKRRDSAREHRGYKLRKAMRGRAMHRRDFVRALLAEGKTVTRMEGSKAADANWKTMSGEKKKEYAERNRAEQAMYAKLKAEIEEHGDWSKIPDSWKRELSKAEKNSLDSAKKNEGQKRSRATDAPRPKKRQRTK